jgi:hypothetical protein
MVTVCDWFGLKTTRMIFSGLTSKPIVTVFSGLASKMVVTISSGLSSKPTVMVFGRLALKPIVTVSVSLASKPTVTVSRFESPNRRLRFGDLGLKITATVSWFVPQNHVGFGLSVAPQNRRSEVGVRHWLRSSGLLRVEASRSRVSQFASKLAEARRQVVHVASSWRLCRRWTGQCDGLRRTLLSLLCYFRSIRP